MATAAPPGPVRSRERPETLADLLKRLGGIPASRIRLHPPPGTATEEDAIRTNESPFRTALCELVDGSLVEKPGGWEESAITCLIAMSLLNFTLPGRWGRVLGPTGMLRLGPGLIRAPAVSFFARGKRTKSKHGGDPAPAVAPDLAIDVLRQSNTRAEIARKLAEYFAAGTQLAWVVDRKKTVRVHQSPERFVLLGVDDMLDGGDVLPGLRIPIRDIFDLDDE